MQPRPPARLPPERFPSSRGLAGLKVDNEVMNATDCLCRILEVGIIGLVDSGKAAFAHRQSERRAFGFRRHAWATSYSRATNREVVARKSSALGGPQGVAMLHDATRHQYSALRIHGTRQKDLGFA